MRVMEFLVRIEVQLPDDMPEERRAELVGAESVRGKELIRDGKLKRIWRVPGRWANVSLYDVADASELHSLLQSLPLFAWFDVDVEPLAVHPLEA
jgi:muconolactone D-isomerase